MSQCTSLWASARGRRGVLGIGSAELILIARLVKTANRAPSGPEEGSSFCDRSAAVDVSGMSLVEVTAKQTAADTASNGAKNTTT